MDDEYYTPNTSAPSDGAPVPIEDPGFLVGETRQGETTFVLDRSVIMIGSDDAADIQIKGRTIAPNHAEIIHEDGAYHIRHTDGGADVCVNGETIRESLLADGDTVAIGDHLFTFQLGRAPKSRRPS